MPGSSLPPIQQRVCHRSFSRTSKTRTLSPRLESSDRSIPARGGVPATTQASCTWENKPRRSGGIPLRHGPTRIHHWLTPLTRWYSGQRLVPGAAPSGPAHCSKRITLHHTFPLPRRSQSIQKASKRLSKNKKRPSAPRENTPPDEDRRRLRSRQTPDQRRKYDRSRNQSPERKEYNRQRRHQDRQTARETGKCRGCPNPSLPNSGRCQACTEKHRKYSVARRARQKSEREINEQGRSPSPAQHLGPNTGEPEGQRAHPQQYQCGQLETAKAIGKCKHCPQPAIPGQTRCESCAEKHRISRRKNDTDRRARQKAERQLTSSTGA